MYFQGYRVLYNRVWAYIISWLLGMLLSLSLDSAHFHLQFGCKCLVCDCIGRYI